MSCVKYLYPLSIKYGQVWCFNGFVTNDVDLPWFQDVCFRWYQTYSRDPLRDGLTPLQHTLEDIFPILISKRKCDHVAPTLPLQRWVLGLEQIPHGSSPLDVAPNVETMHQKVLALTYLMCPNEPKMPIDWPWTSLMDVALFQKPYEDGCHQDDLGGLAHHALMPMIALDNTTATQQPYMP